jgi:E3 ubiquitin-protein ligase HERC2
VIPISICTILTWQMIETRATGNKTLDVSKLKSITDYNGCSENDDFIGYFWEVLVSFSPEERSLYLKFVWGRARLPGTTEHRHKIVAMQYHANACLPVSHTCFFTLDLPRYPSVEIARERIWYAIKFCGDIDADLAANEINHDE